jgi:hypothetical protein
VVIHKALASFKAKRNVEGMPVAFIYPSDLKLQRCWLLSLTPLSLSNLMGLISFAA